MQVAGTSFIKFLGYKRRSTMFELESKRTKRECLSMSEDKTEHTLSYAENEMEIDSADCESLFIQLSNGDYTLNCAKIPKNNTFIIPEHLKERKDDNTYKGWRYIDFIVYLGEPWYTRYYD